MDQIGCMSARRAFVGLLVACFGQLFGENASANGRVANSDIDPIVLREQATCALNTFCVTCRGPEKQKGDLRLDALETIDPVDLQDLYANMQEVIQLGEMPPEKAKQPKETEKKILLQWLESRLTFECLSFRLWYMNGRECIQAETDRREIRGSDVVTGMPVEINVQGRTILT